MPNEDIQRLKDDLSTMRQAMKLDKPYDARDIPSALLIGVGALIALPLIEFTAWDRQLILIFALLPGLAALLLRYAEVRKTPPERTELRKELKIGGLTAVTVLPAVIGFLWWGHQNGLSREACGAGIIFCIGVVMTGIGVLDSGRRSYLISGVGMIAFGVLIPVLTPQRIATVGTGVMAFICLLTAAYYWWQTRLDSECPDGNESVI